MLCLYLEAPFAACRTFTAGWYRPTATFVTPTTIYGLLLNVAGIESRLYEHDPVHTGKVPASLMSDGLPPMRLALGIPPDPSGHLVFPRSQSLYQQLHNYPVGVDAGMPAEISMGRKNNITPVRREFLSDVRVLIGLDTDTDLEDRVRRGIRGELNEARYGMPFLGDNSFLLDRLEERMGDPLAYWYEQVAPDSAAEPRPGTTRVTTWIDRADMSRTRSCLFAPAESIVPLSKAPVSVWITVSPVAA